ncbi:MAG TPA: DMT family transporter [Bacteroidales bacterium]|nr:DMT family transporter [Bacteroidales bacterium]
MNPTKQYQGHIALLCSSVFFGLNFVISKGLLNGAISPVGLNALRFLAGAAVFWLISMFMKSEKVSRRDLMILFGGSVLGLMLNQILFVQGLSKTSAIDASIISTTVPMLTMIFSAMILKEPISWMKTLGVIIGGVGAIFLIITSLHGLDKQSSLLGDLLCLASSAAYSLFLVVTKPISQRYSPVTVMKWMFLFAVLLVIPFSLNSIMMIDFMGLGTPNWLSLGFVLVFATIIPYFLIPVAQKKLRPTIQAMYNYVLPIVATALAVFTGTGTLTVTKVVASVLVFAGVYIVTRSKSRADIEVVRVNQASKVHSPES